MATDVETLMVRMEANTRGYERELAKMQGSTRSAMRKVEAEAGDGVKRIERLMGGVSFNGFTGALKSLALPLAGTLSTAGFLTLADAFTRIENSLKVAGLEGEHLTTTLDRIFAVAQKNGAPVEDLAKLYGQLSQAQSELGVGSENIITAVDAVGAALRVSGVSSTQAQGAILGLSQAMSSGTVRAEEFNQMVEGGLRPALQVVANNIEEAAGSVGKLRNLIAEGEVSSRLFFAALEQGKPELDALADKAGSTTAQAFERLKNEATKLAGEINEATGASKAFAGTLNDIAKFLGDVGEIIRVVSPKLKNLVDILAVLSGFKAEPLTVEVRGQIYNSKGQSSDDLDELDREEARAKGFNRLVAKPRAARLSTQDPKYSTDDDEETGGTGNAARGRAQRISDYDREVEALNRRTQSLNLDIASFGQSAQAISRAKIEQQLLNALQKDGVTVSDEQRAKISELAGAFAETEAKLRQMNDAQKAFADLQQFVGQSLSGFFSDVVSGGKNAEDALMNLTKRLADAAFQAALLGQGPLAGMLGAKNGGGLLGTLFSGIKTGLGFASGGYVSGPGSGRSDSIPARLSNGEFVVNAAATRRNRALLESVNSGRMMRFADGGFVGRAAGAAMSAGGGGGISVVINNNNSKASVTARESSSGGQKSLEIMIDEVVAGRMQTPGSQTLRALQGVTGAQPQLTRR